MIVVFDMDDTLYDELSYVRSGFAEVARMLAPICRIRSGDLLDDMWELLEQKGRGRVFDDLLIANGHYSVGLVRSCVQVYRNHRPTIALWPAARECLKRHADFPLYVVSDGNTTAQHAKAVALGLYEATKYVLLTHRFGIRHAKPSPYCFQRIAAWERVASEKVVYVADNPEKDFVGLRPLGFRTVRVLTGQHARVKAKPGYDADQVVSCLSELEFLG